MKNTKTGRKRIAMIQSDMRQISVLIIAAAVIGMLIDPHAAILAAVVTLMTGLGIWYLAVWKL